MAGLSSRGVRRSGSRRPEMSAGRPRESIRARARARSPRRAALFSSAASSRSCACPRSSFARQTPSAAARAPAPRMNDRIRSASARSRIDRTLEAHQPSNQRVVAAVGRVWILGGEPVIEPMLGRVERSQLHSTARPCRRPTIPSSLGAELGSRVRLREVSIGRDEGRVDRVGERGVRAVVGGEPEFESCAKRCSRELRPV
jgi:hypothetical protein